MTSEEKRLLEEWGYRLPATAQAAAARSDLAPVIVSAPLDEIPPLDREGLETLLQAFEINPAEVLARARVAWDSELTEDSLRQALVEARDAMATPVETTAKVQATAQFLWTKRLPAEFTFPLMDLNEIPINIGDRKFETKADASRWAVFCGPFVLESKLLPPAPFRWHSAPAYPGRFVYKLLEPTPNQPLRVALFSDFGTGLYHSCYIAKQIRHFAYPYAIHLGDVYYAGRASEYDTNFKAQLDPILARTKLFTMLGNHDMYSSAFAFFDYLDERKRSYPNLQEQQGSYFALRSQKFQIVVGETEYFDRFRCRQPDVLDWMERVLREGRNSGLMNILLTSDQPYEYGKPESTMLFRDLELFIRDRLIDVWFWGNTHYCALFDRSEQYPFIGSCIGHGGYPYSRYYRGQIEPAPVLFLETQARFPSWTNVRQDRGNNGYCVLELADDGTFAIRYLDWMGNERCLASLRRLQPGTPIRITVTMPV